MKTILKHVLLMLTMISFVLITMIPIVVIASSTVRVQYIKPEELKKLMESKDNILVVDVQPKRAYDLGHIKGAINFPWAMDIKRPGNLPKDKMLILYCDCAMEVNSTDIFEQLAGKSGSCSSDDDSTNVADQLMSKFGYKNIKILEGGWSRWKQLGYPIEKNRE